MIKICVAEGKEVESVGLNGYRLLGATHVHCDASERERYLLI